MSDSPIEMTRSVAGLTLLLVLLTWETYAPFHAQFRSAPLDRVRHDLRNLVLGGLNATLNALICVGLWWSIARWAEINSFGLFHWVLLPAWVRLVGIFLLMDFWIYIWHRLNHCVPFLWRFHRVHHSDPKMDVTTAVRFHFGEITLSCVLRVPVIALMGIQIWELVLFETVLFAVVQLHHANIHLTPKLERMMRIVIVTPSMHKVHHSNWQPETDSNYSSLFSFWDRLFHTFRMRDDLLALRFGLDELSAAEHQTLAGILKTPIRNSTGRSPRSSAIR